MATHDQDIRSINRMIHESFIEESDYTSLDSNNASMVMLSLHRLNYIIMIHFTVGCDRVHLLFSIVGS